MRRSSRPGVSAPGIFNLILLVCVGAFCAPDALSQDAFYEQAPINYSAAQPADAVAALKKNLAGGAAKLSFDPKFGYLPELLKALHIPVSSQLLVFSKTSLQRHFIGPETPRALYFNDNVYVGYANKGEVLEVAATDPQLGAVFYTVSQTDSRTPKITRQTHACLQCHDSSSLTLGVPGYIMRSLYTDLDGMPIYNAGTHHTTQDSPFGERWGGWYVSGTHGAQTHLGNTLIKNKDDAEHADFSKGQNVTDLSKLFDTSNYLQPHSDIVALLVVEHQTSMHNLIARTGIETRLALLQEKELNKALGEKPERRSPSTMSRVKSSAEPLLKYMLFSDEAKLTARVQGTSAFAAEFAEGGIKDPQGRSLRELDLETRLLKYPCSYLIYSEEYSQLPDLARDYLAERLTEILSGKDTSGEFKSLSPADRRAIWEILAATWKGAPPSWAALLKTSAN